MEDWKYEMFVKLKRDDPDAFAGLDLNYNMKQCYQRQADRNFEIINGNLCQAVKSKKKVTKWLTEDIPDAPKLNVHYTVEVVREIKWVAVARQSDRTKLFYEAHDERGHPGRDPTLAFIKLSQHWWGMKQDVEKYIRSCEICQRTRVDETKPPLEHIIEDEPFGRWQIDLTQIPGVPGYFLVVIDCFTKFVWFKFLPTKHAVGVLSFLMALVKKEGRKPRKIHSDNGGEFIADILKQFCEEFGIELIHGRPYHPQSQGQVERVNRTLKAMLYKMLEARFGGKDGVSSEDLESSFDEVVDLYNNNKHSSTGFSPMQLQRPIIKTPTKDISLPKLKQIQHKEMVSLFAIAHDNLVKAAEKQDKVHNAKHHSKLRVFKVGQKVLYRWPVELRANGDFLYNSIARITKEHKNGRYGLEWLENEPSNSKNRKTWSAGELKLYRERDANNNIEQVSVQNPSDVSSEGDIGEKQMDEVEEQESIAPECNNTGDGNNTNVRSAPNDLCSLYDGLMDADDQITEDQWLELTDPLPTDTEKDQEIEECNTEKELNANQPSDCQPTNAPDYQVYQPRKRRRITQTSKGSQSRLWKEIGLNNDD